MKSVFLATTLLAAFLSSHEPAYAQRATFIYEGEHPYVAAARAEGMHLQNTRQALTLPQLRYESRRDLRRQWRADRREETLRKIKKYRAAAEARKHKATDYLNGFVEGGMIRQDSGVLLWPEYLATRHEPLARRISIAYRDVMTGGRGGIGSTAFQDLRDDVRKFRARIASDAVAGRITPTEMAHHNRFVSSVEYSVRQVKPAGVRVLFD